MRARHRLPTVLRYDFVHCGGRPGTGGDVWLRRQRFDSATVQLTLASDKSDVDCRAAKDREDATVDASAADSRFTPLVHRLYCGAICRIISRPLPSPHRSVIRPSAIRTMSMPVSVIFRWVAGTPSWSPS